MFFLAIPAPLPLECFIPLIGFFGKIWLPLTASIVSAMFFACLNFLFFAVVFDMPFGVPVAGLFCFYIYFLTRNTRAFRLRKSLKLSKDASRAEKQCGN